MLYCGFCEWTFLCAWFGLISHYKVEKYIVFTWIFLLTSHLHNAKRKWEFPFLSRTRCPDSVCRTHNGPGEKWGAKQRHGSPTNTTGTCCESTACMTDPYCRLHPPPSLKSFVIHNKIFASWYSICVLCPWINSFLVENTVFLPIYHII